MTKKDQSKKNYAVALRYDPDEHQSPEVIAKGEGWIGERILKLAEEHQIPHYVDAELVQNLMQLDLASQVPPELYEAVASVLAFVYQLDQKTMDK